jgi:hypothetical protein
MMEHIHFLHEKAVALRDLAQRAPLLADQLHRMADELDATAANLEQNKGGAPNVGEV